MKWGIFALKNDTLIKKNLFSINFSWRYDSQRYWEDRNLIRTYAQNVRKKNYCLISELENIFLSHLNITACIDSRRLPIVTRTLWQNSINTTSLWLNSPSQSINASSKKKPSPLEMWTARFPDAWWFYNMIIQALSHKRYRAITTFDDMFTRLAKIFDRITLCAPHC